MHNKIKGAFNLILDSRSETDKRRWRDLQGF